MKSQEAHQQELEKKLQEIIELQATLNDEQEQKT